MKVTLQSWLWLFASIVCYSFGEIFSKKIAERFSGWYVLFIALGYAGSGLCWIPAIIQRNSLITLGFVWSILSIFSTLAVGLYFGESLVTHQVIGLILGITALMLLSW